MQWLRNLPISSKFIYAFGIVCGLCIALGVFTFITFRGIATKSKDVSDNALPSLIALANISTATHDVRREDLDLLLCQTAACSSAHNEMRLKGINHCHWAGCVCASEGVRNCWASRSVTMPRSASR